MNCHQCGEQIADSLNFCPKCGAPQGAVPGDEPGAHAFGPPQAGEMPLYPLEQTGTYAPYPAEQETVIKPKKKKLKMILIIAACAVVVAVGILVPVLIEKDRADRYNAAMVLMDDADYETAKAGFLKLGEYKRSDDLAQECQDIMDYTAANALMDAGDFEQAKQAFAALNGYSDTEDLVLLCQNNIDYIAAAALMADGSTEAARDAFLALGAFQDSANQAEECQNRLDYDAAAVLMAAQDFEAAQAAFEALGAYSDAMAQALACENSATYIAADTAFNEGKFYSAYVLFGELGTYNDAMERAAACIQPAPEDGEIYRNPDYSSKSCAVNVKVGDDPRSVYLKFYTESDVVVSTVFVSSGQKTKIKLPSGTYRIKAAYGYDWFGEGEVFGGDGAYEILVFDGGTELTSFSSSYIYTLSFLLEEGGNIGGNPLDLGGF